MALFVSECHSVGDVTKLSIVAGIDHCRMSSRREAPRWRSRSPSSSPGSSSSSYNSSSSNSLKDRRRGAARPSSRAASSRSSKATQRSRSKSPRRSRRGSRSRSKGRHGRSSHERSKRLKPPSSGRHAGTSGSRRSVVRSVMLHGKVASGVGCVANIIRCGPALDVLQLAAAR